LLTILLTEILQRKHWTILFMALALLCYLPTNAQVNPPQNDSSDTLQTSLDTLNTPAPQKKKSILLSDKVDYDCQDSTIMDWVQRKAYLYNNAYVKYEDIELKAAYIEIDFDNNTIFATGLPDSTGQMYGLPIFKDGDDEYETTALKFDIETKKGIVYDVTMQEGDIYTHVTKGKKMPDNTMYVQGGHFTTCSHSHPHYRIRYNKAKVIPKDKIVTGPIYMEIGDVILPFALPFGYFPNKRGRANGIIIPSYGYSASRGFYLSRGGYYTGLGEQMDLAITGDFYSKKSYRINLRSNYNVRYKYDGFFNIEFADFKSGETDTEFFSSQRDFKVKWQHRQSNLANPNSSFSANVEFGTKSFDRYNSISSQEHLNNTTSSNISYTTKVGRFNLGINAGHSQNNKTGAISINAPSVSLTSPRWMPLKGAFGVGKKYQIENLTISYRMNMKNQLNTADSLIMDTQLKDFMNGIEHNVPINLNLNFGVFKWNNSVNIREKMYFQTLNQYYQDTIFGPNDTINGQLVKEMVSGFKMAHYADFRSDLTTQIFGMFKFKWGPVKAMRHVITPAVGFNYIPDLSEWFGLGYYQYYDDQNGVPTRYSIFDNTIYGGPSIGHSGRLTASLNNNLEIKVKNRRDTTNSTRKIKLIESLRISTYYDLAKDSFNLAPLRISGRTTLFKGMTINYDAIYDFYALNANGRRINSYNWKEGKNILRNESGQWRVAFQYSLNPNTLSNIRPKPLSSELGTPEELNDINMNRDHYVDFNIPWNLRFSYDLTHTNNYNYQTDSFSKTLVQTLRLSGDINITNKWKFGFSSGYDLQSQQLTYTTVDIYRDLHCWEMIFSWVPTGITKRYEVTVRVKSPVLQDLKLNRKRNYNLDY
jgi:hypothetical protein